MTELRTKRNAEKLCAPVREGSGQATKRRELNLSCRYNSCSDLLGSEGEPSPFTDITFAYAKKKNQTVHKYENFKTRKPDIKIEFGKEEASSNIMKKIKEAQAKLSLWDEEIFGKTETQIIDGKEVKSVKQNVIPRKIADLKDTSLYGQSAKEIKEKEEKIKTLEESMKAIEDSARTDKKDRDKYQEYQKELTEEVNKIVEVRDGVFGEYLGYGPVFKAKDLDYTAGPEKNVEQMGRGELNAILLDFQWNSMQFDYGQNQLSLPAYEKKLWMSDGWFEAPTIKSVAALVCDIAGTATGQSWWLGIVDDALFSVMDIGMEGKDAGEVAVSFAKAVVQNEISAGISAAGEGIGKAVGKLGSTGSKIAANAAWGAGSTYVSSVAGSYVNSLNYSAAYGFEMNWEEANKSWYSADTIAGALSAGATAGIDTGIKEKLKSMGNNGAALEKFYGNGISLGKDLAGKATGSGLL